MIPPGHEAEYFGFYEITDKGASWLGRFSSVWPINSPGQRRLTILSLLILFLSGLWLLCGVNLSQACDEAGQASSAAGDAG